MRKPSVSLAIFLLVFTIVAFFLRSRNPQDIDYDGFNRNFDQLEYSRHARCRMDCRQVSEAEVLDILKHGQINPRKTRLDDKPCPTYALEGYSQQDHQHLRIVFAQCDNFTKVVTCIDLDRDLECHCP